MCEDLKRDFYAACPVWYWPVLWWQFVVMECYLGDLYAASRQAEMTYGLALGPRGTLHLVFLSDAARQYAEGRGSAAILRSHTCAWAAGQSEENHPCGDFYNELGRTSLRAVFSTPTLYLDPG